jgi:hypothetical protein
MSFIRKKIQIISYEFMDKCKKSKESMVTEKGTGIRIEEIVKEREEIRNCFIYINMTG